ncbi:MAG: cobalamin B12-binding domain-containing protein, partial [bacterium]
RPLSDRSKGPRIVCATLPGETHYLGLQMAATVLSLAGCRVIYLGSDTPVEDVVDAAHAHQTSAVCISISIAANRFMASRDLSLLRERLNPSVALVTGGLGAPEGLPGVELVPGLDALLEWGQNLIAHSNAARK